MARSAWPVAVSLGAHALAGLALMLAARRPSQPPAAPQTAVEIELREATPSPGPTAPAPPPRTELIKKKPRVAHREPPAAVDAPSTHEQPSPNPSWLRMRAPAPAPLALALPVEVSPAPRDPLGLPWNPVPNVIITRSETGPSRACGPPRAASGSG
jgi:hypothetical protein